MGLSEPIGWTLSCKMLSTDWLFFSECMYLCGICVVQTTILSSISQAQLTLSILTNFVQHLLLLWSSLCQYCLIIGLSVLYMCMPHACHCLFTLASSLWSSAFIQTWLTSHSVTCPMRWLKAVAMSQWHTHCCCWHHWWNCYGWTGTSPYCYEPHVHLSTNKLSPPACPNYLAIFMIQLDLIILMNCQSVWCVLVVHLWANYI